MTWQAISLKQLLSMSFTPATLELTYTYTLDWGFKLQLHTHLSKLRKLTSDRAVCDFLEEHVLPKKFQATKVIRE